MALLGDAYYYPRLGELKGFSLSSQFMTLIFSNTIVQLFCRMSLSLGLADVPNEQRFRLSIFIRNATAMMLYCQFISKKTQMLTCSVSVMLTFFYFLFLAAH